MFQKRFDGSVDFYRNWAEYRDGFGDLNGEFWLGNDKVSKMTDQGDWELRVDLGDWSTPMEKAYAKYKYFRLGSSDDSYKLQFDKPSFNGTAGENHIESLKGFFTPKINQHTLCSVSQLSMLFLKIIYASYSKLSKELKK